MTLITRRLLQIDRKDIMENTTNGQKKRQEKWSWDGSMKVNKSENAKEGGQGPLMSPKIQRRGTYYSMPKTFPFQMEKNKLGNFETFSHDIVDYQEEAIFDDAITVGELYSVLKMGVLRFYSCTKVPKDEDDEECVDGETNVNTDVPQNNMLEQDEPPLQTVDIEAFLDTSEVTLGPYVGEPMAHDTLLYQPGLQVSEDIAIVSVLFPRTSSAVITSDTARVQAQQALLQSQQL